MKMAPLETASVKEEDEVLRCVREIKSELAEIKQDNQSVGYRQTQITKFEEEQKAAMTQLQQQMRRIEQMCTKLSDDLDALATKA